MIVVAHIRKFYDWDPVPKGTVVTEQDIAAGKVMPGRDGGYRMRVVKVPPGGMTTRTVQITEAAILAKIIEEKTSILKAGRTLTRKDAIAAILAEHAFPDHVEIEWLSKFEVHDDGPHEELARATLTPHTTVEHGRRPGRMNIPPDHLEGHVGAYMADWKTLPKAPEGASPEVLASHEVTTCSLRADNAGAMVQHLTSHFGVR